MFADINFSRKLLPSEILNAFMTTFDLEQRHILLDYDWSDDWYYAVTDHTYVVLHYQYAIGGQFPTRIEVNIPKSFTLGSDYYRDIGSLCNSFGAFAITSDPNGGLFHWIVIRKPDDFSRVYVDPDVLNTKPVDTQFQLDRKLLDLYLSQAFSNELIHLVISEVFSIPRSDIRISQQPSWEVWSQYDCKLLVCIIRTQGNFLQHIHINYRVDKPKGLPTESDVELVEKICQLLNCDAATYGTQQDFIISPSGEHRTVQISTEWNEQQTVTVTDVNMP